MSHGECRRRRRRRRRRRKRKRRIGERGERRSTRWREYPSMEGWQVDRNVA
jgi:hypothetical protein